MARPARGGDKGGGDSKQGLIITLVFFVLLSIGLGVGTYYGFAGQKEFDDKAKKAAADLKNVQSERDWHKFMHLILKAYAGSSTGLGKGEEADLAELRNRWDGQQLAKEIPGADDAAKFVKHLDDTLGWDAVTKKVRRSYFDLLAERNNQLATSQKNLEAAQKDLKDYQTRMNQRQANADNLVKQHEKKIDELNDTMVKLQQTKSNEFKDLVAKNEQLQATIDDLNKKIADSKEASENQTKGFEASRHEWEMKYQKLESEVKPKDWDKFDKPKGKIVGLDRRGDYAFINLGSADNVKPQLKFSVFGATSTGNGTRTRKAALEVVDVLEPHFSRARIIDIADAKRDPVVRGDLLVNNAWNPTLKEHIAIAGLIDLTGDGSDGTEEFMRDLQKQNVVIDAYLDLKSLEIRGKMGFNTGYLVIGEMPEIGRDSPLNDPRNARKDSIFKKVGDMQDEAKRYGITIIPARRFMSMIGYRVPTVIRPPDYNLRGPRPVAAENGEGKKPEEAKKEDKAPDAAKEK
jgi:hypothetical protein